MQPPVGAPGRTRFLAGQREVADMHRLRRIGQIPNLRHAQDFPAGQSRVDVGDAGIALPRLAMGGAQVADDIAHLDRLLGDGDVPHLVRPAAVGAHHVELRRVALGQILARAHLHHLRPGALAALDRLEGCRGNVMDNFRLPRVGDVHDHGAVALFLAGKRVDGAPAVRPDVGEPARALFHDDHLERAAPLEIAVPHQPHVPALGAVPFLRMRNRSAQYKRNRQYRAGQSHIRLPKNSGARRPRRSTLHPSLITNFLLEVSDRARSAGQLENVHAQNRGRPPRRCWTGSRSCTARLAAS